MVFKFHEFADLLLMFLVICVFFLSVRIAFGVDFESDFGSPRELEPFRAINDGARAEEADWQVTDGVLGHLTDNIKVGSGPSGNDPAPGNYLLLDVPESIGWVDYTVSADFVWIDDGWWGIMFYYTDELNYYRYRVRHNSRYILEKFVDGVYTELVSKELDIPILHINLKASITGDLIEVFGNDYVHNDAYTHLVHDTDLNRGSIAFYIRDNSGWIDNLKIVSNTRNNLTAVGPADRLVTTWAGIKNKF